MLISNKYEVEGLLGKGSMGEVYKVRHVTLGSLSALKVLPAKLMEHPDLLTRFYREARVMAKLVHPNIVRVVDIDHDDVLKFHYIVMEFIEGRTLRDYLEDKKVLTLKEVLSIARQIAQALQFAHSNHPPVIHRDIKPSNIMLEQRSQRAVLMDFGIAKELDEANMTRCEMMLGTVRYCPREQMLYEPLDGSADIYALGMVMYEAYTGEQFFAGMNENQVISSVLSEQVSEPVFNTGTPLEFRTLIAHSIAKARANRYHRMSEFLADLEVCWSRHVDIKGSQMDSGISPDNITDLDEHIQRLEHEKQRRLALSNKTACQDAREQARLEGAEQSVRDSFLEGCRQESSGNEYLNQKDYGLAQKAFLSAAKLFSEAMQKASAIRMKEQAEQIKQQVQAVKTEADSYNAKENARTFYGRALSFQSQAEELLETLSYKEAYENFSEAFRIYQDARELAYYKSLKEAAEALCVQVKEAYDEAVKAEAKEMAPTLFKKAIAIEQKAKTAFSSEDLQQANELFRDAIENYTLARRQVMDQRKHLDMLKARKQALEYWHRAKKAGAELRFREEFAEASQLKEQGQYWETQQQSEQAADYYTQAASAFHSLEQETEVLAAQDQVEVIKQQLDNTKAKFQALRAWAKDAWAEADALMEKADSEWRGKHYPQARKIYIKALEAYTLAQQQSIDEQSNEQVQLLQARLEESLKTAVHFEVEQYCQAIHLLAVNAQAQGQESLKNRRFKDALEHLKKAREYLEQAVIERHQQLKLEIAAAQQQAKDRQAQDYASTLYHKGLVSVLEAEEFWEQSNPEQSYDKYSEAFRLFKDACSLAERTLQKEETEAVQVQVREAFDEACAVDANGRFPGLFQQAVQSQEQADAAFRKEDYSEAKSLYRMASDQFLGVREKGMELIKGAQKQADEAQRLADQAGVDIEQGDYQQALLFYQTGEELFQQEAYRQALSAFESARAKFQQVRTAAENGRRQHDLIKARERAEEERLKAEQVEAVKRGGDEFVKAAQLMEEGHQWNNLNNDEKATRCYEQAAHYFEQLTSEALSPVNRQGLEQSRQRVIDIQKQLKPFRIHAEKSWNEAEKLTNNAEKAFQTKELNQASELFGKAYAAYLRVRTEAEQQVQWRDPGQEEQTIVVSRTAKKDRRFIRRFPGAHYWFASVLVILVLGMGGYQLFNRDAVKRLFVTMAPDSEITIGKITPAEQELSLRDGHSQTFSVEIPNRLKNELRYSWLVDGKEQGNTEQWRFSPPLNESENASREIKVVITDRQGHHLEHSWKVKVEAQQVDNNVKLVNHPPRIVRAEPLKHEIMLRKMEALVFSAEATDLDPEDPLTYLWYLDGQRQSESMAWIYKHKEEGEHKVTLIVADKAGRQDQQVWTITTDTPVINQAPRIVKADPAEHKIEIPLRDQINFSAEAAGVNPDDPLTYAWLLDGREQSTNRSWLYRAESDGQHKVVLKVADQKGMQAQRSWLVKITAPPATCVTLDENSELCMPDPETAKREEPQDTQVQEKAANRPGQDQAPGIIDIHPAEETIETGLDDEVQFSVEASSDDPEHQLNYRWSLDGRKKSTDSEWFYQPKAVGKHKVTLKVTHKKKVLAKRSWQVITTESSENCIPTDENSELCLPEPSTADTGNLQDRQDETARAPVTNHAPRIIKSDPPEQNIELRLGTQITFTAEAEDSDPDDQLTYIWLLDGKQESTSKTWLYKPKAEGQHKVALKVSDRAGKQDLRNWRVAASAPPANCIPMEDNSELCMPEPSR